MKLQPSEAAEAASIIYSAISRTDIERIFKVTNLNDHFQFSSGGRFEGVAGLSVFKYRSGFGVMAKGKGKYQGDVLLAIRGTDTWQDLILTDFNIGLQTSSTGKSVHSGFNRVFKSFESDISRFLRGTNPTRIHCVGHSLGGALASMAADMIAEKNMGSPILYTFGSPRVGTRQFSGSLTKKVEDKNIFRVSHSNDIVTMIPMWPFVHIPQPGTECFVQSPLSGLPAHAMKGYIGSVSNKQWVDLKVKAPQMDWDGEIETWLGSKSVLSFTFNTMKMINNAIIYILKKIVGLGMNVLFGGVTAGLTLLDQLAMILERGARVSREVSGFVMSLLQKILSMLGHVVGAVTDLTLDFVRFVLTTLSRRLYQLAGMTLSAVHSVLP